MIDWPGIRKPPLFFAGPGLHEQDMVVSCCLQQKRVCIVRVHWHAHAHARMQDHRFSSPLSNAPSAHRSSPCEAAATMTVLLRCKVCCHSEIDCCDGCDAPSRPHVGRWHLKRFLLRRSETTGKTRIPLGCRDCVRLSGQRQEGAARNGRSSLQRGGAYMLATCLYACNKCMPSGWRSGEKRVTSCTQRRLPSLLMMSATLSRSP